MDLSKIELLIHPVRFRILQTISNRPLNTQEIAEYLPDVPKSSIYRHLKSLLDGEMVKVAETRLVHGIQEKKYELAQRAYLDANDMAGLTADEHLTYFTTYLMTLLQGFADYLSVAGLEGKKIDMVEDRVGYTEITFFASPDEFELLQADLNKAVLKLANNKPGNGRVKQKLVIVSHPIITTGSE